MSDILIGAGIGTVLAIAIFFFLFWDTSQWGSPPQGPSSKFARFVRGAFQFVHHVLRG